MNVEVNECPIISSLNKHTLYIIPSVGIKVRITIKATDSTHSPNPYRTGLGLVPEIIHISSLLAGRCTLTQRLERCNLSIIAMLL